MEEDGFEDLNEATRPETTNLGLPSAFPSSDQIQYSSLQEMEKELREAQAFDCLRSLRKCLSERVALLREKSQRARGRYESSRSTTIIKSLEEEVSLHAVRYRIVYAAFITLGGSNPQLKQLEPSEVTAANVFSYSEGVGRGTNTDVSWIWRMSHTGEDALGDNWLEEGTSY